MGLKITMAVCMLPILPIFYYENGAVIARHWEEVYRIDNAEIKSVTLLQERPDIRRRSGTAMQTVEKGFIWYILPFIY